MTYEMKALSPDLGVELCDFDPRELDSEKKAAFRQAFVDHHLVLIRGVELSEDQQTELTEVLGEVSFTSPVMRAGGERKFSYISNQHSDGKLQDGELLFHSDHMFFQWPLKAIALYSLATPSVGGETLFTNAAAAYRRLPESLKTRIASLEARHIASYGVFEGDKRPKFDPKGKMKMAVHPLVWTHPENGEPVLFASRLLTESVMGLPSEESEALLEELFSYIESPEYVYTHKWQVGDYLVWDNRQLQHSRKNFDSSEKRALRRVPIAEPASLAS